MPEDASTTYLAFDLGASSGRAILGTLADGRMGMKEVHRFDTPILEEGERLYWDLEALWKEIEEGLSRALEAVSSLRSVSVDSWAVDYVPLDHDGEPVRNPHCYRDPRTHGMVERALARVPAEELYDATGIQFMPINTLYQVLADLEYEPDLVARTANRLPMADYFNYRLSGRAAAEVSIASATQLMDVRRRTWAEGLMRRLDIHPDTWPEIVPSGTRLGSLKAHARTPVDVIAGCSHDTACAVAAVPVAADGSPWAYLSSGTWSLLGVERAAPVLSGAAREASFTNEAGLDGTIRFLKNLTGLWVLQECEREWREAGASYDYDTLFREAEAAPASRAFVDLNDPRFTLRGDMVDKLKAYCRETQIRVPTSRGELVRLILESLADSYRQTLRALEDLIGERIDVLHVVGGGSRNTLLCRWTADACRCRVVAGPAEATALGNLLIQARTMGDLPAGASIRDVMRRSCTVQTYEPREEET